MPKYNMELTEQLVISGVLKMNVFYCIIKNLGWLFGLRPDVINFLLGG